MKLNTHVTALIVLWIIGTSTTVCESYNSLNSSQSRSYTYTPLVLSGKFDMVSEEEIIFYNKYEIKKKIDVKF